VTVRAAASGAEAVRLARSEFAVPLAFRLIGVYVLLVAATLLIVAGITTIVVRSHLERVVDAQLLAAARSFERGPATQAAGLSCAQCSSSQGTCALTHSQVFMRSPTPRASCKR
jgi:hypothetical protein